MVSLCLNTKTSDSFKIIYHNYMNIYLSIYTLRNKGTKAFTGAVSFQKVHVCT